ncbi:hypothetical protein EVB64_102 [Rhizobium phage RHph_TM61]|nr:hypothetical protein EVB64_102 [Rhizobium phage RHph_TM61]
MKPEYEAYLRELIDEDKKRTHYLGYDEKGPPDSAVLRAKCMEYTKKFIEKFPHLKRVSGFIANKDFIFNPEEDVSPGTEHWWCVDVDGMIVDPTRGQFTRNVELKYIEFDEKIHQIQIGKCPNCGMEIYGLVSDAGKHGGLCSEKCFDDYSEYMNGEMKSCRS